VPPLEKLKQPSVFSLNIESFAKASDFPPLNIITSGHHLLLSKKLIETLDDAGITNIEYLPATETIYLAYSVIWTLVKQNYSIKFRDDENDEVTYTVTPETDWWTITIDNWTILTGDYDWNNEAYIFFEYIAPYSAVWAKTITVTINDGSNVTIKTLNVYIY